MRRIDFKSPRWFRQRTLFLVCLIYLSGVMGLAYAKVEYQPMDESVFAMLGKRVITVKDYNNAFHTAVRQKTYHGKFPQQQLDTVRRDVGRSLIARALLLSESRRRNIQPDSEWVNGILANYQERNAKNADWQEKRKIILPKLKQHFEEESLIRNLHTKVTELKKPDAAEIKKYYQQHQDKFTQPARYRVSVILLKVEPSLPAAVWKAANEEAERLLKHLNAGADFSDLAKLHSADTSANQGGDMGYLHKGMLAPPVQKIIDTMKIGDVSRPITILQGVGIFYLDDKKEAKLNTLKAVRERAAELLLRDKRQYVWKRLIDKLWKVALIKVNKEHSPLLAAQKSKGINMQDKKN